MRTLHQRVSITRRVRIHCAPLWSHSLRSFPDAPITHHSAVPQMPCARIPHPARKSHRIALKTPARQAINPPRAAAVKVMNNTDARQAISHLATGSNACHSHGDSLGICASARPHIFTLIMISVFPDYRRYYLTVCCRVSLTLAKEVIACASDWQFSG